MSDELKAANETISALYEQLQLYKEAYRRIALTVRTAGIYLNDDEDEKGIDCLGSEDE